MVVKRRPAQLRVSDHDLDNCARLGCPSRRDAVLVVRVCYDNTGMLLVKIKFMVLRSWF